MDRVRHIGIKVEVHKQQSEDLPDSVFPDWFSTHRDPVAFPDGLLCTFPMKTPSREAEKNPNIIRLLEAEYKHRIDLKSEYGASLEGPGTLILDKSIDGLTDPTVWCSIS